MAILETTKDRDSLAGNGSKQSFDFSNIYIQEDSDIEVYIVDTTDDSKTQKTLDSDYSVTDISDDPPSFTVTFDSYTPTSDEEVFVQRRMPRTQEIDLEVVTDYDERKITNIGNKLTALVQELFNDVARCIKTPDESDLTELTLPATLIANKAFKVNSSGDGVELSSIDVDDAKTYATNASASADAAAESESNAANSETAAANSETNAAASALQAANYAHIQVTGLTLSSGSWSLNEGLYEYDLANDNILATSIVDVIPDNDDIDTVKNASILPGTDSSSGSVKIYAENEPTADIGVTINIKGATT
jgi:hypothetical protein